MSTPGVPQILVVLRGSPMRERTAALLESVGQQKPAGVAKVVLLSLRHPAEPIDVPFDGLACVSAEPDWMSQVRDLAARSGCRWLVMPSSMDRYLPGALEAVLDTAREGHTIVGACQIAGTIPAFTPGPIPFRFDYLALLSGFNYIAQGATFVAIDRWLGDGGFDSRFASAATYEYLLRTGAAGGVVSCAIPIVETEASPFPGVPTAWALLHAAEMLSIALAYNKSFLVPGAALGLAAALAEGLEVQGAKSLHDEELLRRLTGGAAPILKAHYLECLRTLEAVAMRPADPTWLGALRLRARAMMAGPIWNALRRSKRAWQALREPLD